MLYWNYWWQWFIPRLNKLGNLVFQLKPQKTIKEATFPIEWYLVRELTVKNLTLIIAFKISINERKELKYFPWAIATLGSNGKCNYSFTLNMLGEVKSGEGVKWNEDIAEGRWDKVNALYWPVW
jgi:hypothetical protein